MEGPTLKTPTPHLLILNVTLKSLFVCQVERYYEELMSELERRETQFSSVQDRGESLIIARHPASPVIDAHMKTMQAKWAWLLQLTLCLETHLRYSRIFNRTRGMGDAKAPPNFWITSGFF